MDRAKISEMVGRYVSHVLRARAYHGGARRAQETLYSMGLENISPYQVAYKNVLSARESFEEESAREMGAASEIKFVLSDLAGAGVPDDSQITGLDYSTLSNCFALIEKGRYCSPDFSEGVLAS